MSNPTQKMLVDNIGALGIGKGDIVLVRAALRKIGIGRNRSGSLLIKALLDVVGTEGTIIGLTFTKTFFLPRIDKSYIFTRETPTTAGGFAQALLEYPNSFRSKHPSNSYAALGAGVYDLLHDHDEYSSCFLPVENLINANGKMILIGCVSESPGFTTVHLAQEKLGLSSKSILKGLVGVYYEKNSEIKLFKRKDFGGCSEGFYKFYDHYKKKDKLISGMVGNAYSIAISARDAFEIELELIRKNKTYPLCDDPKCFNCRGTWWYNKHDMFKFYIKYLPKTIKRFLITPKIGIKSNV